MFLAVVGEGFFCEINDQSFKPLAGDRDGEEAKQKTEDNWNEGAPLRHDLLLRAAPGVGGTVDIRHAVFCAGLTQIR